MKEIISLVDRVTHLPAKAVPLPEDRDFTSFNFLEGNMGKFPLNKGGTKGRCFVLFIAWYFKMYNVF